ncbi:ATP-dependent nuclease [Parabacteroides johnsonii]|nr:AAA family ATPase [Parabacteroides johnsonii]
MIHLYLITIRSRIFPMYISKVSLVNYRNFENSFFLFNKGINTIIGENASGKTNLFRAIRLILDDNLLSSAYKLNENDFNRNLSNWKGKWIIISLEFSEISADEAIQALFVHGGGNVEGDITERATYNLFFRPKPQIRKLLSELKAGDKDGLGKILDKVTIDDYETFFTGKSTVNFNDKNVQRELMGDFEKVEFNFDIDESKFGSRIPHQLSISKEVSFTFIKALRDVVSDFQDNRKNPLLTLFKSKSEDIKKKDFSSISGQVEELNQSIEKLEDIQEITDNISNTIKEAVGTTYSPSSLSIKSNVPSDVEKLFQSLKLFIGEPEEDYEGGVHELSLGGANLIFLTLKLLEYKYRKEKDKIANFLLIEEPEAHIHTHIQKALFDKIDYPDTQIIYSTHSTHISEVANISNMNIISRFRNYSEVYQPFVGLSEDQIVKIQRFLDAIRCNLLFAKSVILVEGDAEEIIIPIMVKKTLGVSLDELGISLINVRSTGFENLAQLFHNHRIKKKCAIITDLDASITGENTKAAKIGISRKEKLEALKKKSKWIKAFYASHTFEIDFFQAGNFDEILSTISEVYVDKKAIKQSKEDIKSGDIKKYGKRILTIANNMGKGWYAILLSNQITPSTHIPNYILEAILFAKSEFSKELLSQILTYVLSTYEPSDKIEKLNKELLAYKNDEITLDGLKKDLEKVIDNTEPILYILNRL